MSEFTFSGFTFLGTADSKGVPRFWCECAVCTEARQTGVNRRTRTTFLLQGLSEQQTHDKQTHDKQTQTETVLLDASNDLHTQLSMRQNSTRPQKCFFLTRTTIIFWALPTC